ncbi:MAG: family 20 glycosylhydrolase [Planctomycetaceae bacterium]
MRQREWIRRTATIFGLMLSTALLWAAEGDSSGHPTGADLSIRWTLIENAKDSTSHLGRWEITNNGDSPLPAHGWTIYFNMLHMATFEPMLEIPETVTIKHFNGDLLKLQPTDKFEPVPPGETFTFEYRGVEPINKPSWAPSGVYIVFEDENGVEEPPTVIGEMEVTPFTRPEQISRGDLDLTPVPTPDHLYEQNQKLSLLPINRVGKVTPTPVVYKEQNHLMRLDGDWTVRHEEGLEGDAAYLVRMLEPVFGKALNTKVGSSPAAASITLRVGDVTVDGKQMDEGSEAYTLTVNTKSGVDIVGADADGVFYGIQTLLQLLPPTAFAGETPKPVIPYVQIEDAPRFEYRGQHIDVSHNFHSKESILMLLDRMAFYKLNKFHFQVSDDEGWRIDIPELPELTEIGGGRAHTSTHEGVLHPTYGVGPFRDPPTYGTGFYTRDDFIEIIKHAHALHIDVIPEINMPAHARAAIIAMREREDRLWNAGQTDEALKYRLHDPDDTSRYISAQGFLDNATNVVDEPLYRFAETIIRNFEEMFAEAEVPLDVWHFGADEVPRGVWVESPRAAAFLKEHPEIDGPNGLKNHFVKRIIELIESHNLQAACWQEAALDHVTVDGKPVDNPVPEFAGGQLIPYVWNNLRGNEDLSARFANAGYPVVLCCVSNLYFDLAYNKDPLEPGLTWGGFIDARSPFEFVPEDVFKSTRVDAFGQPYDREQMYKERESLTDKGWSNVLGIQGQIWCETIHGPEMLEYYVYPKQISLAERAWAAQPEWAKLDDLDAHDAATQTAWNEFANRLGQRELPRLDSIFGGTLYRLPPPGGVIENGMLHASTEYPGLRSVTPPTAVTRRLNPRSIPDQSS